MKLSIIRLSRNYLPFKKMSLSVTDKTKLVQDWKDDYKNSQLIFYLEFKMPNPNFAISLSGYSCKVFM